MSEAARSFVEKQLGRESAYRLLPVFAPGLGQGWLPAWVALLGEIDESGFERSDLRVAQTKLAWWGTDLAAGEAAQHPLSRQLMTVDAARVIPPSAWQGLARDALEQSMDEDAPRDWEAARARWLPLAGRVAEIETGLFGLPVDPDIVALQWQRQRAWHAALLGRPEQSLAPLGWQADCHAKPAHAWRDFMQAQHGRLQDERASKLPLHRALLERLWRWRLAGLTRGVMPDRLLAPAAPRLLWTSWRAALRAPRR